jgi:hypothetical protein
MCHRGIHPIMIVTQFHSDLDRLLGEGHQEYVLK